MKSSYLLIFLSLMTLSCTFYKTIKNGQPGIDDNQKFPSNSLTASNNPYNFPVAKSSVNINPSKFSSPGNGSFENYLKQRNTVAMVIIRNDTLVYENYFEEVTKDSAVLSFSVSKSFTSALIGSAISDGLIKSINDPITNYLPEMERNNFNKVTIKHLLQMTSGIKFREDQGSPFHEDAKFYYGGNLTRMSLNLKLIREPGIKFEYASGNTQLLGLILGRTLKGKSISQYLQEKLWNPLGMESSALWSKDRKNGIEKMACCLSATARDFAKFGNLYLHEGKFADKQIIPRDWVKQSTEADTTAGGAKYYKFQWWLSSTSNEFLAEGIINQYIYVNPGKKMVIVKLSKGYGVYNKWSFFRDIANQL